MFAVEKPHLRKVSSILSFESNSNSSISRTVHKDNIIKYKSNRYSLPLGTYKPHSENKVYVSIDQNELIITKEPGGEPLATHPLSHGIGQLIKNTDHSRDKTKGIQAYMYTVIEVFEDSEKIGVFLEEIHLRYPRYIRDQLQLIKKAANDYKPFIQQALDKCIEQKLWSANDLRDLAEHFEKIKKDKTFPSSTDIPVKGLPLEKMRVTASTRELDGYLKILGGV